MGAHSSIKGCSDLRVCDEVEPLIFVLRVSGRSWVGLGRVGCGEYVWHLSFLSGLQEGKIISARTTIESLHTMITQNPLILVAT